jgi:hypothetical protein
MVQVPSEAVTIVLPSAVVVVLALTDPLPECTDTLLGPVVWLLTPPGPALTLLETPEVLRSFILRSTTLQFLLPEPDDEDVAVPPEDDAELDELLDVCACTPAAKATADASAPMKIAFMARSYGEHEPDREVCPVRAYAGQS